MPNRYEREIEEILRNLEQSEPRSGGQRFSERERERFRGKPGIRMRQPRFSWRLSSSNRLLLVAVVAALVAGGYAYLTQHPDLFSLILVIVSLVCIVLVACSSYLFEPRRRSSRGYRDAPPTVVITPIRRNPLNFVRTQWNLLMLRLRYRRKNGR